MPNYTFLDAYSSVQSAASSVIGGSVQLPVVNASLAPNDSLVSGSTSSILQVGSIQVLAAPGSGLRNYVTNILVTNGSSVNGTFVRILDGGGGSTLYEGYAGVSGGGFSVTLPAPLRQTANTALYAANVSPSVVTVISASGFKAT